MDACSSRVGDFSGEWGLHSSRIPLGPIAPKNYHSQVRTSNEASRRTGRREHRNSISSTKGLPQRRWVEKPNEERGLTNTSSNMERDSNRRKIDGPKRLMLLS